MISTITLNPSVDQIITVSQLVKDDANRALSVHHLPGGKGVNVSKVIRELGGPTHAYTLQAGFIGKFWAAELAKLGVAHSPFQVRGETRINAILTDVKDHTQTRISAPGPALTAQCQRVFLGRLLRVRPRPFCWALGGSPAGGMKPDVYKKIVSALQRTGVPCILDADDEPLRRGVEAKPFMIKPNEYEMQRLTGQKLATVDDYYGAAMQLVEKGIRIVVVSLAAKGAIFVTKEEAFHVLGIKVAAKNKVGAGDSLVGGFALGLYRRLSLERAAALGVAASVSAISGWSPRHCRRQDIPRILKKIRIKKLR